MTDELNLNLEAAVEILNKHRWRDRDNWRAKPSSDRIYSQLHQIGLKGGSYYDAVSIVTSDALAIAKSLVAEKRIAELEHENADYAEYMQPLLRAMNVASPSVGVEWVRIVLEQRDTAQQDRHALQDWADKHAVDALADIQWSSEADYQKAIVFVAIALRECAEEARAEGLEDAARLTENYARQDHPTAVTVCDLAAAAIRDLKEQPK